MSPTIVPISWEDVTTWLRRTATASQSVDCIIGVARSGVPLATALSYLLPNVYLGFATRSHNVGPEGAFYDFAGSREDRSRRILETLLLPPLSPALKSILVIDDVATFGDTLHCVHQRLGAVTQDASVKFATYAADTSRLRNSHPDVLSALTYNIDIDNESTYVTFPWNISA